MRLLLITQRIDARDTNLAVHVRWLREIASQVDHVDVIAQSVGDAPALSNVTLRSLGKEQGKGKFGQMLRLLGMLPGVVRRADAVLVLMVPLYVLAAWPFAFLRRKPMFLWYTHKHVSWHLRIAERLLTGIFSASKESFRLPTRKVQFLGHAVDTEFFSPGDEPRAPGHLVTVGRIAPAKRIELMIDAVELLRRGGRDVWLDIIGEPILESDKTYADVLRRDVEQSGLTNFIHFLGPKSPEEVVDLSRRASVCLNASVTGSLDKAGLEAMATGCPFVTTNEAFRDIVPEGFVSEASPERFALRISEMLDRHPGVSVLRDRVLAGHDMKTTLTKLLAIVKRSTVSHQQ